MDDTMARSSLQAVIFLKSTLHCVKLSSCVYGVVCVWCGMYVVCAWCGVYGVVCMVWCVCGVCSVCMVWVSGILSPSKTEICFITMQYI